MENPNFVGGNNVKPDDIPVTEISYEKKNHFVWYIALAVIIIIAILIFKSNSSSSKPDVQDITSKLPAFLTSQLSSQCQGSLTIDKISDVSIGDYIKQIDGWPVYASNQETCQSNSNGYPENYVYNNLDSPSKKVPAAYARKVMGQWQLFVPEVLQSAKNQMQNEFQNAVNNVKFK